MRKVKKIAKKVFSLFSKILIGIFDIFSLSNALILCANEGVKQREKKMIFEKESWWKKSNIRGKKSRRGKNSIH